jgi:C4-dicarboxylate-specific signal transduction histidine kinase
MGEMATGLAHELNQPLCAIVNYLQGCSRSIQSDVGDRDRLLDSIARAAAQAERAGQIIERIREFVRKGEARRTDVDVNSLLREAVDLLTPEVRHDCAELVLALADSLPPVLAEPIQIQQVIVNLVRNSLEAMADVDADARQLTIRTAVVDGGCVELAVSDTGLGLPQGEVERAFDAFFTTKSNGMGMGLAIGRSIIEAYGGRLWAESNPDCGATFRFTLPISDGDKENEA